MSRIVPSIARRSHERSSSPDADLMFMEVTHRASADVIRLVIDGVDYKIGDDIWHKSFFEYELVTDTEDPPTTRVRFANVDRKSVGLLTRVVDPARVRLMVITSAYFDLSTDPRTVKAGYTIQPTYEARSLDLIDVTINDITVEGTLKSRDLRQEVYPNLRAIKSRLPGAHLR